jgi:hypothetical protein
MRVKEINREKYIVKRFTSYNLNLIMLVSLNQDGHAACMRKTVIVYQCFGWKTSKEEI